VKSNLYKYQSVKAYANQAFGTRLRQWDSLESLDADGFQFPIAIRYKHPIAGGGPAYFGLRRDEIYYMLDLIEQAGFDLRYVYYNECSPDHLATLQGEVCESSNGQMYLKYNTVQCNMRYAMLTAKEITGRLSILNLLQHHMTESSFEDFNAVLEVYTLHVIEFTCFECMVGNLKGRNTIIWDARLH